MNYVKTTSRLPLLISVTGLAAMILVTALSIQLLQSVLEYAEIFIQQVSRQLHQYAVIK